MLHKGEEGEKKSVHLVWNSHFEVSDALEVKENSWLQRTAQVPQGSSWLLFYKHTLFNSTLPERLKVGCQHARGNLAKLFNLKFHPNGLCVAYCVQKRYLSYTSILSTYLLHHYNTCDIVGFLHFGPFQCKSLLISMSAKCLKLQIEMFLHQTSASIPDKCLQNQQPCSNTCLLYTVLEAIHFSPKSHWDKNANTAGELYKLPLTEHKYPPLDHVLPL